MKSLRDQVSDALTVREVRMIVSGARYLDKISADTLRKLEKRAEAKIASLVAV